MDLASPRWVIPSKFLRHLNSMSTGGGGGEENAKKEIL